MRLRRKPEKAVGWKVAVIDKGDAGSHEGLVRILISACLPTVKSTYSRVQKMYICRGRIVEVEMKSILESFYAPSIPP